MRSHNPCGTIVMKLSVWTAHHLESLGDGHRKLLQQADGEVQLPSPCQTRRGYTLCCQLQAYNPVAREHLQFARPFQFIRLQSLPVCSQSRNSALACYTLHVVIHEGLCAGRRPCAPPSSWAKLVSAGHLFCNLQH